MTLQVCQIPMDDVTELGEHFFALHLSLELLHAQSVSFSKSLSFFKEGCKLFLYKARKLSAEISNLRERTYLKKARDYVLECRHPEKQPLSGILI